VVDESLVRTSKSTHLSQQLTHSLTMSHNYIDELTLTPIQVV
jgi:hypothetical protein